jgi:hypothetical protein
MSLETFFGALSIINEQFEGEKSSPDKVDELIDYIISNM